MAVYYFLRLPGDRGMCSGWGKIRQVYVYHVSVTPDGDKLVFVPCEGICENKLGGYHRSAAQVLITDFIAGFLHMAGNAVFELNADIREHLFQ